MADRYLAGHDKFDQYKPASGIMSERSAPSVLLLTAMDRMHTNADSQPMQQPFTDYRSADVPVI